MISKYKNLDTEIILHYNFYRNIIYFGPVIAISSKLLTSSKVQ